MPIQQGCDFLLQSIQSLLEQGAAARHAAAALRKASTPPLPADPALEEAFSELADCLARALDQSTRRVIHLQNLIAQFPRSQPTALD